MCCQDIVRQLVRRLLYRHSTIVQQFACRCKQSFKSLILWHLRGTRGDGGRRMSPRQPICSAESTSYSPLAFRACNGKRNRL